MKENIKLVTFFNLKISLVNSEKQGTHIRRKTSLTKLDLELAPELTSFSRKASLCTIWYILQAAAVIYCKFLFYSARLFVKIIESV